jgi:hypothetical protein
VLFFIKLDTRRVYVAGITANPAGVWVVGQSRNLSMVLVERDAKFIASFDEVFRSEATRIIRTPVRVPAGQSLCGRRMGFAVRAAAPEGGVREDREGHPRVRTGCGRPTDDVLGTHRDRATPAWLRRPRGG